MGENYERKEKSEDEDNCKSADGSTDAVQCEEGETRIDIWGNFIEDDKGQWININNSIGFAVIKKDEEGYFIGMQLQQRIITIGGISKTKERAKGRLVGLLEAISYNNGRL